MSDQTDKIPPHSDESERALLGGMIIDARTALPLVSEVIGDDLDVFYDLRNKVIYETISRMTMGGKPVNLISLLEQLRMDGQANNVGGLPYLAALSDACISPAGVGYFAEILAEYQQKRRLIQIGTSVAEDAWSTIDLPELIRKTAAGVSGLAKPSRRETPSIRDLVHAAISEIEECHQSQGKLPGISTGFADLDKKTSGLHEGEMVVIAARPSMGKTSLAMNIAEHVAIDQQLPVGVFSLEMTAASLVLRMLCSRARVNIRNISDGFLTERDFPKLTGAAGKIAMSRLVIDDAPGLSIMELKTRANRMQERHGIRLLVIDYLQLMRGSARRNADNRQVEVAEISSGIKALAKELNIPVIALSQLNRDMEREKNRRPRLSDLRESGAIEQDADLVAFLWRQGQKKKDADEDDDNQDAASVTLSIAKQRNGPTGDIHLTFLKSYTRFESAAKVDHRDVPSYDTD
jgi:replicative DNA helicase